MHHTISPKFSSYNFMIFTLNSFEWHQHTNNYPLKLSLTSQTSKMTVFFKGFRVVQNVQHFALWKCISKIAIPKVRNSTLQSCSAFISNVFNFFSGIWWNGRFFNPILDGLFRRSFWRENGEGGKSMIKLSCLRFVRIMLETCNLVHKYIHICSFS